MLEAVYRMLTLICELVEPLPVGTHLGMPHLLWMLVSGRLLEARGAVIPVLSACGLPERVGRRAWVALGQGDGAIGPLLARWQTQVQAAGQWQPKTHGGYRPVAVDMTAFWRPRLQTCATTHYHAEAGTALPDIPLGLIARVGRVGGQRLALPLAFVRADTADPSASTHLRLGGAGCGGPVRTRRCAGAGRGLQRGAAAGGRSHPLRGAFSQEQHVPPRQPAALSGPGPPAHVRSAGAHVQGTEYRLPRPIGWRPGLRRMSCSARRSGTTWRCRMRRARATPSPWRPSTIRATTTPCCWAPHCCSPLRRCVPSPLITGPSSSCPWPPNRCGSAARAFVHAPLTCQRLPELALLAGALLSYGAATTAAVSTGFPGPPSPACSRAPPPCLDPLVFSARRPLAHTTPSKSLSASPPAHRVLGSAPPCYARGQCVPSTASLRRLTQRKLED